MWSVALIAFVTLNVVVGDTQDELDYKQKHFCESGETIKALAGADDAVDATKRCGLDKYGKATCVFCNKCATGFQRSDNNCKGGQETQEDLDYKEKHFCQGDETIKSLQGTDSQSVSETKRCGFDKYGKATCLFCNKCANGSKLEGTSCTGGKALSINSTAIVVVAAISLVLLAAAFFVCKSKRDSRSDSAKSNVRKHTSRRAGVASRRA